MPVFDSREGIAPCTPGLLQVKLKGMVEVMFRQRPYAVGAEKLVFVEHVRQYALQLFWLQTEVSLRQSACSF